ncbi:MAG: ABC-2 transporter permease [Ruminococcaceae bacterium]|nr:ABC-2 transporter permease [Oscillospiraceae bacterium]
MKALLYKDFMTLWKNLRSYLLMCAIFQVASIAGEEFEFMRFYPLILVASLPHTLLAYDERSGWEKFALTLPVSRRKLVSAKYLMGLLLIGASFLLAAVTMGIRYRMEGDFSAWDYWFELSVLLTLGVAVMCTALPMTFRMGTEKGRLVNMLSYGILGGVLVIGVLVGSELGLNEITLGEWILVPILAIPAVMLPVSWHLAIRFYEKREF